MTWTDWLTSGKKINAESMQDFEDRIAALEAELAETQTHVGSAPPANPQPGRLWFDTDDQQLYVWDSVFQLWMVNDPIGTIRAFSGPTLPAGYAECDGAEGSLFAFFRLHAYYIRTYTGTTTNGSPNVSGFSGSGAHDLPVGAGVTGPGIPWGTTILSNDTNGTGLIILSKNATATGQVSLEFNPWGSVSAAGLLKLPDLRGRSLIGEDWNDQGDADVTVAIGYRAGSKQHTLTTAELPAHDHAVSYNTGDRSSGGVSTVSNIANSDAGSVDRTSGQSGGGGAHNNMPPYAGVRFGVRF